MKLAFISDIHLNISSEYPVLDTVGRIALENNADILVIAGDIEENYHKAIEAVATLNERYLRTYYVPGNHDLWCVPGEDLTNDDIYAIYAEDDNCLVDNSIRVNAETILIGDVGWYDYSLALETFPLDELEAMKRNGRVWQDSFKNIFTKDNYRKTEYMLNKLEAQLMKYREVRNKIVVTHMIPIKEFRVPASMKDWSYFNAFLGSLRFGELFERYDVSLSVSGHVHYRKEVIHNSTRYFCPCLGYSREWVLTDVAPEDVEAQVRDAMMFYTLP